MNQFLTVSGVVLSENIGKIDPSDYENLETVNITLDGQPHVQTVGTPLKVKRFEILSNKSQVEQINLLKSQGSRFKLVEDSTVYTGLILEKPTWNRITNEYHTASIKLSVKEEGAL